MPNKSKNFTQNLIKSWDVTVSTGGDMGAPMEGFMSSMVAPIPLSSGAIGASSRGAMGSYMSN
jgi:hypothetical protein